MVRGVGEAVIRDVNRLFAEGTTAGASDEQLLSRHLAARDRSSLAFEAIVRRHGPMVLETCRRLLDGDHHAAEDAFQATFLVLARRADSIVTHASGSLGPWLHEVACRTARKARIERFRHEKRDLRAARIMLRSSNAPLDRVAALDDYRVLHEEVSRLPRKHRAAIVLCYFEGLTHDQAAASLCWPVGTVRGYLARARDLLRTRLVRRGVAPSVAVVVLESRANAALLPSLVETVVRGVAQVSAGSTAAVLGGAIVRSLAVSRIRRSLVAVVLLALGAGGAVLVASQLRSSPAIEPATQTGPIVAAQPVEEPARRERLDVHGDPLPDGAVARLGTSRFNHGTNINDTMYTPDGKGLLTFGYDGFVRVWDPTSGRLVRSVIPDGSGGSRLFALSADGKRMVTVERSHEASFRLWDFETGRELRRGPGPQPEALSVAHGLLSEREDGRHGTDGQHHRIPGWGDTGRGPPDEGRARDSSATSCSRPTAGCSRGCAEDQAHHMRLPGAGMGAGAPRAPDAPEPGEKSSIVIWDVAKAAESRRFAIAGAHPDRLVFSPDGRTIAAPCCDGSIRLFEPAGNGEVDRMKVKSPGQHAVAFSRDGRTLASADDTSGTLTVAIHLWDVARRTEIRHLSADSKYVFALAFSPDGRTLASAGWEKILRLWDVATGREIDPRPSHGTSVACLVVSPGDDSVITGGYDQAIYKWDADTGRELAMMETHSLPVYDLAISPDGRYLLSSDIGAAVWLRELGGGQNPAPPLWRSTRGVAAGGWRSRRMDASPSHPARSRTSPRDRRPPRCSMRMASRSIPGRGPASRPTARACSRRMEARSGSGKRPEASRSARSPRPGSRSCRSPCRRTGSSWPSGSMTRSGSGTWRRAARSRPRCGTTPTSSWPPSRPTGG